MTAVLDQSSQTVRELIDSCHRSEEDFRAAAQATGDLTLKRLLDLYAQQRTRFAEELREWLPSFSDLDSLDVRQEARSTSFSAAPSGAAAGLLRECLRSDERTLDSYRQALAKRVVPTRAHFLISAQCSLMERVHDRMHGLLNGCELDDSAMPPQKRPPSGSASLKPRLTSKCAVPSGLLLRH